jgi:predicted PurR-regulated permease PerM
MMAILSIGFLIAICFLILRPFLTPLIWAVTIVVATWPLLLGVQARLGQRRGPAVAVMTALMLMVLIVPVTLAIVTIVSKSSELVAWAKSPSQFHLPPPPEWVGKLPLAGPKVAEHWAQLSAAGPSELAVTLRPYANKIGTWLVARVGNLGTMLFQFVLTMIICAVLYAGGEKAADGFRRFARRLAGEWGDDVTVLAARTIRGVALGVVVTALIQSLIGGIGLLVTGVPGAPILTAVMLLLCIAQVGPIPLLVIATVWLFYKDHAVAGSVLIAFTIVTGTIDNFVRPLLIKKGAKLPLLLIFAGVIGGLLSFGIAGLFIGPVMLAVTRTLLAAWVDAGEAAAQGIEPLRGETGELRA